ncbi:hypothetical protein AKO1_004419 [Acrasis kona]|uniref:Guanylate cyclase domain-containing protein n=1 Tax=Acrasis kona TaxID=1008807 RepID=A0AAW2YH04_9EUKA
MPWLRYIHWHYKSLCKYFMGKDQEALEIFNKTTEVRSDIVGCNCDYVHGFHRGMIIARLLDKSSSSQFQSLYDDLKACRDDLDLFNSKFDTYVKPAYYAIQAEVLRYGNQDTADVMRAYDSAINYAKQYHYPLVGAVAATRLAHYVKSKSLNERIVAITAHDAVKCWMRMGFTRIQNLVTQQFCDYLVDLETSPNNSITTSSNSTSDTVDLQSYTKVSQLSSYSDQLNISILFTNMLSIIRINSSADRTCLIIKKPDSQDSFLFESELIDKDVNYIKIPLQDCGHLLCVSAIQRVIRSRNLLILEQACNEPTLKLDKYVQDNKINSIICLPIHNGMKLEGCLYLENRKVKGAFNELRAQLLKTIIDVSIENARLFTSLNASYSRFLPTPFLTLLNKDKVLDVQAGDAVEQSMCVMFSDIRNFTSITEKMTAKQSFQFVNDLLQQITPAIEHNEGFIDKYIGDAVMALFPKNVTTSLKAACGMQVALARYNRTSRHEIKIGIGIHYGKVMLGTIGTANRLNATVISDTVNIASRLEALTKAFGCGIIVTHDVIDQMEQERSAGSDDELVLTPTSTSCSPHTPRLNSPSKPWVDIKYSKLGRFYLKGKDVAYELYEVYTHGNETERQSFSYSVELFQQGNLKEAYNAFRDMLRSNPNHLLCGLYESACEMFMSFKVLPQGWRGEIKLDKDGNVVPL